MSFKCSGGCNDDVSYEGEMCDSCFHRDFPDHAHEILKGWKAVDRLDQAAGRIDPPNNLQAERIQQYIDDLIKKKGDKQ
jgi:hypothetical protein